MFIFYFILVISAHASSTGCFREHLKEAIEMNRERQFLYAELTQGESRKISNRLIWGERLGLISAFFYDWRASEYQKKGIGVLCDEFVSMDQTPSFRSYMPLTALPPEWLPEIDIEKMEKTLQKGIHSQDFEKIKKLSKNFLKDLSSLPDYYCMLRHILSSIARSAAIAHIHIEKSLHLGLDTPQTLLLDFLELQVENLENAYDLDRLAFSIQIKGIPILCQDVPEISWLE